MASADQAAPTDHQDAKSAMKIRFRPVNMSDTMLWFLCVGGTLMLVRSMWMPWKMTDLDENFGERFQEPKVYGLLYTGRVQNPLYWNQMTALTCDKFEDIEVGSRYTPIAKAIKEKLPEIKKEHGYKMIGGTYFGCNFWGECKDHMGERCGVYNMMRWLGLGTFGSLLVAILCIVGALWFQACEASQLDVRKLMLMQYESWVLTALGSTMATLSTLCWMALSTHYMSHLQKSAYYPLPVIYWGGVIAMTGNVLLITAALVARHRCGRSLAAFQEMYVNAPTVQIDPPPANAPTGL